MKVENASWLTEIIDNAEDIIILFVTSELCEALPENHVSFNELESIIRKRFPDRKIVCKQQCYTEDTMPFPHPGERVYFFHPKNYTVLASLETTYALLNLIAFVYHSESIWKNVYINELLARDGITKDEDLREYKFKTPNFSSPVVARELEYPSFSKMVSGVLKSSKNVVVEAIKNRKVFATDKEVSKRFDICLACPNYSKEKDKCSECGCSMSTKVKFKASECPVSKW